MQKSAKQSNQSGRFSATLVNSKNKSMILGTEIHCIAVSLSSLWVFFVNSVSGPKKKEIRQGCLRMFSPSEEITHMGRNQLHSHTIKRIKRLYKGPKKYVEMIKCQKVSKLKGLSFERKNTQVYMSQFLKKKYVFF